MIPNHLPLLAVGSHDAGSGKACVMNAISYLNGDTRITDMPSCAHPLLAEVAQTVNDSLCEHRDGDLLCAQCSHQMWLLGARIIGTAAAVDGWSDLGRQVLDVRLAAWAAEQVLHLVRAKDRAVCEEAIRAARAWADEPSAGNAADFAANAAYAAAYAANAAASAAGAAAYAAASAANAADFAADAAANAADAANAAALAAGAKVQLFHGLLDEFDRLTGRTASRAWTADEYALVAQRSACPVA